MTTWAWAQLAAGSYGLPGPAVVTSPWVLEVRAPRPRRRGFTRVRRPEQWGRERTTRSMVADCSDPSDLLVVSAEHPADVDAAGLRISTPGAAVAGGAHWVMGGVFHEPRPSALHDQVHQAGRLLLLTGDVQAYWSGVRTGATAGFACRDEGLCRATGVRNLSTVIMWCWGSAGRFGHGAPARLRV